MPSPARRRPTSSRRPNRRPNTTRQPVVSPLDRMLDEALAQPAPPAASFADMGVPATLVTALGRRGITEPFAIQGRALPDGIAGRDVLGRANTGSGKTLAFGLPMLIRLS